jgi:hypothetical protein
VEDYDDELFRDGVPRLLLLPAILPKIDWKKLGFVLSDEELRGENGRALMNV